MTSNNEDVCDVVDNWVNGNLTAAIRGFLTLNDREAEGQVIRICFDDPDGPDYEDILSFIRLVAKESRAQGDKW